VFSLSNSVNDITNGEVIASLPLYANYENEVSPSGEKVVWNPDTHQLRWDVGSIPARTGYGGNAPRTLSFKVSIVPSQTQIGQTPDLVNKITYDGKDAFAGANITTAGNSITTATADSGFVFGDDKVIQ
jgi:hypothetical protein